MGVEQWASAVVRPFEDSMHPESYYDCSDYEWSQNDYRMATKRSVVTWDKKNFNLYKLTILNGIIKYLCTDSKKKTKSQLIFISF